MLAPPTFIARRNRNSDRGAAVGESKALSSAWKRALIFSEMVDQTRLGCFGNHVKFMLLFIKLFKLFSKGQFFSAGTAFRHLLLKSLKILLYIKISDCSSCNQLYQSAYNPS